MNSCNCEAGVVASPAQYNKATACPNPPTQLNTIIIPKEKGGDGPNDPYAPKLGAEQNKIVVYQKTGSVYIYDVNGVYTNLTGESLAKVVAELQQQLDALTTTVTGVQESVTTETSNREAAVAELTASIQALQAALASEASSRETEDTALAQQIATISASSGGVGEALATETQAREAADTALQTDVQQLQTAVASKQDTLESGVNLKTVNGMTLLGPGNVDISGGEGSSLIAEFAERPVTIASSGITDTVSYNFKNTYSTKPLVFMQLISNDHDSSDSGSLSNGVWLAKNAHVAIIELTTGSVGAVVTVDTAPSGDYHAMVQFMVVDPTSI